MESDRLTALEIQRTSFARKLHGWDPGEVRQLLERVALQMELDARERGELRAELAGTTRELEELRQRQSAAAAELAAARARAEDLIGRAEAEAERIVADAQGLAERILDEASRRTESIELVVGQLRARRRAARADLRRLAELLQGVIDEDEMAEGNNADTRPLKVLRRHRTGTDQT